VFAVLEAIGGLECVQVNDHPVAKHVHRIFANDAGGQQVQSVGLAVCFYGMTCIGSPVLPAYKVILASRCFQIH